MTSAATPFLEVDDVYASYPVTQGVFVQRVVARVRAVEGVSLHIDKGEALGLVGESGCGKTSLARVILQLIEPTSGRVLLEGRNLATFKGPERRVLRRRLQMVFQDPYDSLNARMTVGEIVGEGLIIHQLAKGADLRRRVAELLSKVQLSPELASLYPRELSGGQRQRVAIARALAVGPEMLVLDEPLSALDVSIQAQILNLLKDLQRDFSLTYLFISHDLAVVDHLCDRTAVMYLGKVVELGRTGEVSDRPLHPYTQALVSAVPEPDPDPAAQQKRILLRGDLPSPIHPLSGCPAHTRCPLAQDVCRGLEPLLEQKEPGRWVACHFVEKARERAIAPELPAAGAAGEAHPRGRSRAS